MRTRGSEERRFEEFLLEKLCRNNRSDATFKGLTKELGEIAQYLALVVDTKNIVLDACAALPNLRGCIRLSSVCVRRTQRTGRLQSRPPQA